MTRIILTEEQARLLNPLEAVEICDPQGRVVTTVPALYTSEELARIKQSAATSPRIPAEQVERGLKALEEAWEREGPFAIDRAREIMRQAHGG